MCILSALLKGVGYYDFSVLSMSVMGLKKKEVWMGGDGVECASFKFFFGFLELF